MSFALRLQDELRAMLPAVGFAVLLPLPIFTFWNNRPGRDFAFAYLFLGAALAIAEAFMRAPGGLPGSEMRTTHWRARMTALALALSVAAMIFAGARGRWTTAWPMGF